MRRALLAVPLGVCVVVARLLFCSISPCSQHGTVPLHADVLAGTTPLCPIVEADREPLPPSPSSELRGRVVDLDSGRGVADVAIEELVGVTATDSSSYLSARDQQGRDVTVENPSWLQDVGVDALTNAPCASLGTTDADGHFDLGKVVRDRVLRLRCAGETGRYLLSNRVLENSRHQIGLVGSGPASTTLRSLREPERPQSLVVECLGLRTGLVSLHRAATVPVAERLPDEAVAVFSTSRELRVRPPQVFDFRPGERREVVCQVAVVPRIAVVDAATGEPIRSIDLEVDDARADGTRRTSLSSRSGVFELAGIGDFEESTSLRPVHVAIAAANHFAAEADVATGQSFPVTVAMTPTCGELRSSGRLHFGSEPAVGVDVDVVAAPTRHTWLLPLHADRESCRAVTDADGAFAVDGATARRARRCALVASRHGELLAVRDVEVPWCGALDVDLAVACKSGVAVTIARTAGDAGDARDGGDAVAVFVADPFGWKLRRDVAPGGECAFVGLAAGRYSVWCQPADERDDLVPASASSVEVVDGAVESVTLQRRPRSAVVGTLLVRRALVPAVGLALSRRWTPASARTDASGCADVFAGDLGRWIDVVADDGLAVRVPIATQLADRVVLDLPEPEPCLLRLVDDDGHELTGSVTARLHTLNGVTIRCDVEGATVRCVNSAVGREVELESPGWRGDVTVVVDASLDWRARPLPVTIPTWVLGRGAARCRRIDGSVESDAGCVLPRAFVGCASAVHGSGYDLYLACHDSSQYVDDRGRFSMAVPDADFFRFVIAPDAHVRTRLQYCNVANDKSSVLDAKLVASVVRF
jgi:hypothetical protein